MKDTNIQLLQRLESENCAALIMIQHKLTCLITMPQERLKLNLQTTQLTINTNHFTIPDHDTFLVEEHERRKLLATINQSTNLRPLPSNNITMNLWKLMNCLMDIIVIADVLKTKCSKTEEILASYKKQQPTIIYP